MLLNACCVPSALTGLAIGAHRKRPDPPGDTATGQSISKTLADRPIVVESGCRMSQRRDLLIALDTATLTHGARERGDGQGFDYPRGPISNAPLPPFGQSLSAAWRTYLRLAPFRPCARVPRQPGPCPPRVCSA